MLLLRHIWISVKRDNYLTKTWFRVQLCHILNTERDELKLHRGLLLKAIIVYSSYFLKVIAVTLAFIQIFLWFIHFRVALKKGGVAGNFHEKDKMTENASMDYFMFVDWSSRVMATTLVLKDNFSGAVGVQ